MKKKQSKPVSHKKGMPIPVHQPQIKVKPNRFASLLGLPAIILLGIIIYSNSFDCTFHFDDLNNIVDNVHIRNLNDTNSLWNFSQSRFISYFSFALNYHFNELNVWGYHLVNLVIHLINACLVYWLTLLIFSCPALNANPATKHKNTIAFFTALLFVSHPLATQSVTYIVQRMASLAALFYLLSLVFYLKGRLTPKSDRTKFVYYTGTLFSAVLAMLTKENAFTLPFAIVLLEIFFLQAKKLTLNFKDYRIYLFPALILVMIMIISRTFSFSIFKPLPPSQGSPYTITPLNYLFTQFSVIVKYIQLLILPVNQNVDYDYPVSGNFFEIKTLLSFLLLAGIFIWAVFLYKKQRILSFGIFWFFLTLSIESGIIPINDVIFEHRTYLPSFGFFLILSWGIYQLLWNKYKYLAISIFLLIIGSNAILTYQRNKIYVNDLTLWSDVISKSPGKARPYFNRGLAYGYLDQPALAITDYTRAIEINPNYTNALTNRGITYSKLRKVDKAIADFTMAIRVDPKYKEAYNDRGLAYNDLGEWNKAIEDYDQAIAIDPNYTAAYSNRGISYGNLGQWDKAISDFSQAIKTDPGYIDAYSNRAVANTRLKQWDKAIADYTKVIEITPGNANAFNKRGVNYNNLGQADKAIADFSRAIGIDPNFANAYFQRGTTYGNLNQADKAIADLSKAIAVNPGYKEAYFVRGITYGNLAQWDKAIADYTKALEIDPNFKEAFANRVLSMSKLRTEKK